MQKTTNFNAIKINSRKITVFLFSIAGVMLLAHLAGQIEKYIFDHPSIYGLVPLFNLNNENNIPTLFQSVILVTSSFLLIIVSLLESQRKESRTAFWVLLSLGFSLMAVDEWFEFHEKLTQPLRDWIGATSLGVFYFTWVIAGILVVALAILFFYRFVKKLDQKTGRTFILAAFLYIGGLIGFELIGGLAAETSGTENLFFNLLVACEETLEMSGVIVFINGLLGFLSRSYPIFTINIEQK
ncbi:MAG TPA: hypothetical protein VN226_01825 [Anaerolineales bacterium]|nr:hypothetical protein [Anaerolineales bacterium]